MFPIRAEKGRRGRGDDDDEIEEDKIRGCCILKGREQLLRFYLPLSATPLGDLVLPSSCEYLAFLYFNSMMLCSRTLRHLCQTASVFSLITFNCADLPLFSLLPLLHSLRAAHLTSVICFSSAHFQMNHPRLRTTVSLSRLPPSTLQSMEMMLSSVLSVCVCVFVQAALS